jgi:hypothetical protein
MYFITCEKNCAILCLSEAAVEATLKPVEVVATYCCRTPEVIGHIQERCIVSLPHGILTRREILEIPGVIRVRTALVVRQGAELFDKFMGCGHLHCPHQPKPNKE